MANKISVKVIVGSGIAYKASDPRHVFYDVKTADYPWKIFASRGMFIGGQWIKENALLDSNPHVTFIRELMEELSFDKPRISTDEMRVLCPLVEYDSYVAPGAEFVPTIEDERALLAIKALMIAQAEPFGDFTIRVPESLIQSLQPQYGSGDLTALFSIFCSGLSDAAWETLAELQRRAGNLSNESQSIVTSLEEIVHSGVHLASGYDAILKEFFLLQGFPLAKEFPVEERIEVKRIGSMMRYYDHYLECFDVENVPPSFIRNSS